MVSHPLVEGLLGDHRVTRVLSAAPQSYLTVLPGTGPHSTPQVFLAWAGRIWLMTGRETLKAKVLRPRPEAAVLVRMDEESVVIAGVACVLDPVRPLELLARVPEAMLAGPAVAGYLARNPIDLLSFVRDALAGRLNLNLPSSPVLLAVRPTAVALVRGRQVVAAEGQWPGKRETPHGEEESTLGDKPPAQSVWEVPAAAARLLRGERPCVIGWEGPSGPLGLPGIWHAHRRVASVPRDLFALGSLPREARASMTLDAIEEHHPTGKLGVVIDGPADATPYGHTVEVRIQPERVTWWHGTKAQTSVMA